MELPRPGEVRGFDIGWGGQRAHSASFSKPQTTEVDERCIWPTIQEDDCPNWLFTDKSSWPVKSRKVRVVGIIVAEPMAAGIAVPYVCTGLHACMKSPAESSIPTRLKNKR